MRHAALTGAALLLAFSGNAHAVTFSFVPVPEGIQVAEYFDNAAQHRLQPEGTTPAETFSQLVQRFALVTLETRVRTDRHGEHYEATVAMARQWRGLGEPRPIDLPVAGKRYEYTVVDNQITALNERDAEAPPKQLGLAATLFKKPDFVAELGAFLDGRTVSVGAEIAVPSHLSVRLTGLPGARIRLRAQSAYWQRDVAVFDLLVADASTKSGILSSTATASGTLLVDIATARPLQVGLRAALTGTGPTRTANNTFTHAGFSVRTRALSYADLPLFGQGIDVIAPNAPTGRIGGLILARDDAAMLVSSRVGNSSDAYRVALWDLAAGRQAGSTSATVGPHIVAAPGTPMVLNFDNDANGVALTTVGAEVEHFGRVLRSDQPGAQAFGALGVYGLAGNELGEIRAYNFGHNKVLARKVSEHKLTVVHGVAATRSIVTVDVQGMLRRFRVEPTAACGAPTFESYCKRTPFTLADAPDLEWQLPLSAPLADGTPSAISTDGVWLALAVPQSLGSDARSTLQTWLFDLREPAPVPVRIPGTLPAFAGTQLATTAGLYGLDGALVRSFADFDLPPKVSHLAVTNDAKTVFMAARSSVFMFDIDSGVRLREVRSQVPSVKRSAWLDGALIAVQEHGFAALEFATSTLTRTQIEDIADIQFEPTQGDAPVFAVQGRLSGVFVAHAHVASSDVRVYPVHPGPVTRMKLSRGGRFVAVQAAFGTEVSVSSTADGKRLYGVKGAKPARAIAITPAGELLAVRADRLERFDAHGQRVASTPLGDAQKHLTANVSVALSPDATVIAVSALIGTHAAGWNAHIPVIKLFDASTLAPLTDLHPSWGRVQALEFSADGSSLSAGLASGELVTWDVATGMRIARWHAHEDGITSLQPLDARRLLSSGQDGVVRLWDLNQIGPVMPVTGLGQRLLDKVLMFGRRKASLIASVMFMRDRDYAITTPDGYFSASKTALPKLAFRRQLAGLSTFEQFDLWLHRPDVVLKRMQAVPPKRHSVLKAAHAKRLRRYGGASGVQPFWSAAQPSVSLVGRPGGRTETEFALVDLEVKAGDSPVAELVVSANSVPLVRKRIDARAWRGQVKVPLLSGANQLEAYVRDTTGLASARRSWFAYRLNKQPRRRLWVVTIGVSAYQREAIRLRYAAKDARDIATFFETAGAKAGSPYDAVKTLTLTDADVTGDVVNRVQAFLSGAAADDHVMVFVSGHGFVGKDATYYFGTWDVDPADPAHRGLSYDGLLGMFDGLSAHRRVLLLDTCHAGELDPDVPASSLPVAAMPGAKVVGSRGIGVVKKARAAKPVDLEASFDAMREHFVSLSDQSGANVLAAAGGLEFALESRRWSNGVFSFAIMEGLAERRADANADGVVMLSELRAYVAKRVKDLTRGGQQPTSRTENIYLDFPVM